MNTSQIAEHISNLLQDYSLPEVLEIIANVLITEGFKYYDLTEVNIDPNNQIKDIMRFVLNDKEKNGETLQNAVILQGLTIFLWLEQIRNKGNKK